MRPFRYSEEQIRAILATIPGGGADAGTVSFWISHLADDADLYLWAVEQSKILPDQRALRDRQDGKVAALRRVKAMVGRDEGLSKLLEERKEDLSAEGSSPAKELCRLFLGGRITLHDIEHEFAHRVLGRLADRIEEGTDELSMKDGREKKHRKDYLGQVLSAWAWITDRPEAECSISEIDGSPGLAFFKAVSAPVLEISGEAVDERQLCNIVNDLRRQKRTAEIF